MCSFKRFESGKPLAHIVCSQRTVGNKLQRKFLKKSKNKKLNRLLDEPVVSLHSIVWLYFVVNNQQQTIDNRLKSCQEELEDHLLNTKEKKHKKESEQSNVGVDWYWVVVSKTKFKFCFVFTIVNKLQQLPKRSQTNFSLFNRFFNNNCKEKRKKFKNAIF